MRKEINAGEEVSGYNSSEDEIKNNETKKRRVVVPGEVIISGTEFTAGEGARREDDKIIASKYGMAEEFGKIARVIPISGTFIPRRNNVILGRVVDITFNGWLIDIDSAGSAFLPLMESPRFVEKDEMDQFLGIGDIVAAKIWGVKTKSIDLTLKGKGLGKLEAGFIFHISPNRVPRVIGREGSMIQLIKERTGCIITVGQNGWIWIKGDRIDDEIKARRAIEFVADKVYVDGLTEKMEEWFQRN